MSERSKTKKELKACRKLLRVYYKWGISSKDQLDVIEATLMYIHALQKRLNPKAWVGGPQK